MYLAASPDLRNQHTFTVTGSCPGVTAVDEKCVLVGSSALSNHSLGSKFVLAAGLVVSIGPQENTRSGL